MLLNEIKQEIVGYIQRENTYPCALMIDGEWGSGKTYFVKNIIKEINNPKGIYLSLYGLKNSEEISTAILAAVTSSNYGEYILPVKALVEGIAAEQFDKIGGKRFRNVRKDQKKIATFSNGQYFFVFDDLERCMMPMDEVMGYISNFVEQYNAKVIVIGNEKEIDRNFSRTSEFYQIAQNDNIRWPEHTKQKIEDIFSNQSKEQDNEKPSLEEIESRMGVVSKRFHSFSEVKEKIVGRTIHFEPTEIEVYLDVFTSKQYNKWFTELWNPIEKRVELVEKCVNELSAMNHKNLRTLQFALDVFTRFYESFPEELKSMPQYTRFCEEWLVRTIKISCYYKLGKEDVNWETKNEVDIIQFGNQIWGSGFTSVKCIHDYIFRSDFDCGIIGVSARKFYDMVNRSYLDKTDPVSKYFGKFYTQTDQNIEKGLEEVYTRLCANQYKAETFLKILTYLCLFESMGFDIDNNRYVREMKKELERGGKLMFSPEISQVYYSFENGGESFQKYAKELFDIASKVKSSYNASEIVSIVRENKEGWGMALKLKVKMLDEYLVKKVKGVIEAMSAEDWASAIFEGSSGDIIAFREILEHSQLSEQGKDTASKLLCLIKERLEKEDKLGKIFRYNLGLLCGDLEKNCL